MNIQTHERHAFTLVSSGRFVPDEAIENGSLERKHGRLLASACRYEKEEAFAVNHKGFHAAKDRI